MTPQAGTDSRREFKISLSPAGDQLDLAQHIGPADTATRIAVGHNAGKPAACAAPRNSDSNDACLR